MDAGLLFFNLWIFTWQIPPHTLTVVNSRNNTYTWTTGNWRSCPNVCGEGQRFRDISCRDSSGFMVSESNCESSQKPAAVGTCFRVCESHVHQLRWRIGSWSVCMGTFTPLCLSSSGIARREVACVWRENGQVMDDSVCAHFWDRPDSEMSCSTDCPQNCVLTKRNISCLPVGCPESNRWTEEVTDIVVAPSDGSLPCTGLKRAPVCRSRMLSALCKKSHEPQKPFLLQVGAWSPCRASNPPDDEPSLSLRPAVGESHRNISCLTQSGKIVSLSMCGKSAAGLSVTVRCAVTVDCLVSPFSEWRVDTEGCITSDGTVLPEVRTRKRRLLQLPVGPSAIPCPPLIETRVITRDLPSCYKHQWHPLDWSECQVRSYDERGSVVVEKPSCGSGLQYRSIICLRERDARPVPEELCKEPRPSAIQRCEVACVEDCLTSHWSPWGPCIMFRGKYATVLDAYRIRERGVVRFESGGGKACPHLQEAGHCVVQASVQWHFGEWSPCFLDNPQATCGSGNSTRTRTCVKLYEGPTVDSTCEIRYIRHDVLKTMQACHVPCPRDCVLSEWSEWSLCKQACKTTAMTRRQKTLLAAQPEGETCDTEASEEKVCPEDSCKDSSQSHWQSEPWGPCKTHLQQCGVGRQTRNIVCVKNYTSKKKSKLCKVLKKPLTERECEVPCPVDCVLTNFSDWTQCNSDCTQETFQTRYRYIANEARHGGKPCPDALQEARLCAPAFCPDLPPHWDFSPWSECILPNEGLHWGFQLRNVSCLDNNSREVEAHQCLIGAEVPSGMRPCEVTSGCTLTAWSPWTLCSYKHHAKRYRYRELLDSSDSNCPKSKRLQEEEKCPALPSLPFMMEPTNLHWSSCILQNNNTFVSLDGQRLKLDCGEGYQYKFAITAKGPGVEKSLCLMECPKDCIMSEWGAWSSCDVPCGQGYRNRHRTVLLPPNSSGRPCPTSVLQQDVCHIECSNFYWHSEAWKNCVPNNGASCGNGTSVRLVRCVDRRNQTAVNVKKCDPLLRPEERSSCRMHCPDECVLSSWTWHRKCSEPCSKDDYAERRRSILRHPGPGSPGCGPLVQRDPCVFNVTCHDHELRVGPWADCVLPGNAICGKSVRRRALMCIRSDGHQVDHVHCEKSHHLVRDVHPLSKTCYVECPVDCILSEWSAWNESMCTTCSPLGFRIRKRFVVQDASETGRPCSVDLEQQTVCPFKECYHWRFSSWGPCTVSLGSQPQEADCGHGVRHRAVECVRHDGLVVDRTYCLILNATIAQWSEATWLALAQDISEQDACHIPCPGDCIVSEWSSWSHCHKNCHAGQTIGYQTSSRKILFSPTRDTESCPRDLLRTRPCWSDDCNFFRWKQKNGSLVCEGKNGIITEGGCRGEPCAAWCEKLGARCHSSTGLCLCRKGTLRLTIADGPCPDIPNEPKPPVHHSASTPEIRLKYYPDDSKASFWMYAMISIGMAFVVFVFVTIYLMCRSSMRQRSVSVERQRSLRRRTPCT